MKIDIYTHILPVKYKEALFKLIPPGMFDRSTLELIPPLSDLEHRFRIMDKYEGLKQVLTLSLPPIESVLDPQKAADLAKLANDEIAELVLKYPDRFAAAAACLPMNNTDAALLELDRAINDLGLRGVMIYTPVNDKPLDSPEFMPIYDRMSRYNLPIWIHPVRSDKYADYRSEDKSLYRIYVLFGWPFETAAAMARLVFSGVMEKYPDLKIITHHCGSLISFFSQRIALEDDFIKMRKGDKSWQALTKDATEYFKMFYNDVAIGGNTPALMCAHAFFGSGHMLFGTDMPLDTEFGDKSIRRAIRAIEQMNIPDSGKKMIFEGNARKLLNL